MIQLIHDRASRVLQETIQKLSDHNSPRWVLTLERLYENGPMKSDHKVFWTLEIGVDPHPYHSLRRSGMTFSDGAAELAFHSGLIRCAHPRRRCVDLAVYTVEDLVPRLKTRQTGDSCWADLNDVLIGAEARYLHKVHSEVPALLRREYRSQMSPEELIVPFAGSDESVFVVLNTDTGEPRLGADEWAIRRSYPADARFVFEIPG